MCRRSVLSTIRMTVGTPTQNSRVLHAVVSSAGHACCNCQLLKTKCWACRRNAQEISMYLCTDCGNAVCEDHVRFGSDGLERCARCNTRRERADAGPPPPPPPGGGGGQGGPSGQGGGGCGGHGTAPFLLDLLAARVVGLLPLLTLMELGTINVVRVSMAQPRALVPALASPTLLQAILRVSGMPVILERAHALVTVSTVPIGQGMAVFFLKQSGETTGETSAPSVALESPLLVLLLSHALAVE